MADLLEQSVDVRNFAKGVNLVQPINMIDDSEVQLLENFDIGLAGELKKRPGWVTQYGGFGANSVQLLGLFQTPTYHQFIVFSNGHLYYSNDGLAWTDIGAYTNIQHGCQYGDNYYIVRDNSTVLKWTGAGISAIASSPSGTFCYVYKDRLFILNTISATVSSRLYFSAIADFTSWPSTNTIDIRPGDGDQLICGTVIHDVLLLFKTQTTWGLFVQGTPDLWTVRNINLEIGCVSKNAITSVEDYIYFVGIEGIYKTDGVSFDDISVPIFPVLQSRVVTSSILNLDHLDRFEDKIICLLHPDSNTYSYYTFYFRVGGWSKWPVGGGAIKPAWFTPIYTSTPARGLWATDNALGGKVYKFGAATYQDDGNNFTAQMITKEFEFAMPAEMKRGKWASFELTSPGNVTCSYIADGNAIAGAAVGPGVIAGRPTAHRIIGPGYFRNLSFKILQATSDSLIIYGITMKMSIKARIIGATK